MKKNWRIETQAIQEGFTPKDGDPRILPIYQSTTFKFSSAEHVAKLFDLEVGGHFYTRLSNPTAEGFEMKIAAMEGGIAAMATSSGQAASTLAVMNICRAGQHVVAASTLYGGTYSLFANTFPKMGIEVTFVDPEADDATIVAAFRPETRCLFGETIGNPGLNILDFDKFSRIAKKMQVPLIIDNTFPTPYLCRPLEHGADIVIHSATKYIDGHATSVGGVIVDSGNFDWGNGKYPEMTEPDESYHGLQYLKTFGKLAYIVKARVQLMRDIGPCPAPMNAFLFNLGLETLPLRMQRHSENALAMAKFLEKHEAVSWVSYPGLESHKSYARAQKYLPKGASGVLTFGIKGGAEAGKKFMESCQLVALVVHVGDARSCVLHPASTTHRQLSEEQQIASGVSPDLIRLSVGIEHIDDLIEDVNQALLASQK
ncbi:O-acetylhomoserine aminocarboxypropyltransferase/cysteine synthase family protein [Geomonas subterranea]|uniref:O-acetylhomoserine aminocarboxypropyltransferase/cysteine synthase n=1 Tax=Geomonas subterranea TaxID=2847989 RepID=A0ABX8LHI1_9BACT|nr:MULTISPECIES: O-acetylhomoserine aminocarboxypropyltransferase/cysteine synthase family protein [Geomonas]QXE89055.1 O-acetylhomoserine aminocarboxypropyltransferase/cysteine synthase [Geomonas subterranea]QXM08826.1 O-acetylhomoserine aminocarboxypropyltransferase/cysteine synthase [Geomonas subterranea]